MIRRRVCPVFSRRVSRNSISVGQNAVAQRPETGCYENVIDTPESLHIGIEPIFRASGCQPDRRRIVSVAKYSGFTQQRMAVTRFAHVEISRENDTFTAAHLPDLVQYQPTAFYL